MTEDDKNLRWEEISTEHLITDQWIDLRRSSYRMPDGKVYEPYYTYTKKSYAVIVARDENGRYLCVRQFRQGRFSHGAQADHRCPVALGQVGVVHHHLG